MTMNTDTPTHAPEAREPEVIEKVRRFVNTSQGFFGGTLAEEVTIQHFRDILAAYDAAHVMRLAAEADAKSWATLWEQAMDARQAADDEITALRTRVREVEGERDAHKRERIAHAELMSNVVANQAQQLAAAQRVVADENAVVAFMNRERRDRGVRTLSGEKEMLVRRAVRLARNGATNMALPAPAGTDDDDYGPNDGEARTVNRTPPGGHDA